MYYWILGDHYIEHLGLCFPLRRVRPRQARHLSQRHDARQADQGVAWDFSVSPVGGVWRSEKAPEHRL